MLCLLYLFLGHVAYSIHKMIQSVLFTIMVNKFSLMSGRSHCFLGLNNQYARELMWFAQRHNTPSGNRTQDLLIRSPMLYHQETVLPSDDLVRSFVGNNDEGCKNIRDYTKQKCIFITLLRNNLHVSNHFCTHR